MSDETRLGKLDPTGEQFGPKNPYVRYQKPDHYIKGITTKKLERVYPTGVNVPRGFIHNVWTVGDEVTDILIKKQADYGPHNIGRAPGGALNGLIVRIHDKVSRILHLTSNDVDPQNESLRDSYVDLANYALIALMVLDGTWPKE
jgi:hypothetical protein